MVRVGRDNPSLGGARNRGLWLGHEVRKVSSHGGWRSGLPERPIPANLIVKSRKVTTMKRQLSTLVPVFGTLLALPTAISAYAQQPLAATHKPVPAVVTPLVANPQTAVGTSLCYTCGGDWPIFSGYIPTATAADERGSGCAGGFGTSLNDHTPYICTR
jgi:hypothetical protein